MQTVTISRLAERIGVSADTIRYYRDLGLLNPRQSLNGYYEYTPSDALMVLYTRERRGQDLSLQSISASLEHETMSSYGDILSKLDQKLRRSLEITQLALERVSETQQYISCGIRLLREGGAEAYQGLGTWTLCTFDSEGFSKGSLAVWTDHFPFTYAVIIIPTEELTARRGSEPYKIGAGCGALDKYVRRFELPHEHAVLHPAARYARACITLRNPFEISSNDIRPLLDYAEKNRCSLSGGVGARLLFIEDICRRPLYYLMIWGRLDPNG